MLKDFIKTNDGERDIPFQFFFCTSREERKKKRNKRTKIFKTLLQQHLRADEAQDQQEVSQIQSNEQHQQLQL